MTISLDTPPTNRDLHALAEQLYHGDQRQAADCMGVSLQTLKNHVSAVLRKTGAQSCGQAAVILGWVTFPDGIWHRGAA